MLGFAGKDSHKLTDTKKYTDKHSDRKLELVIKKDSQTATEWK
jgi:hypothetical protein